MLCASHILALWVYLVVSGAYGLGAALEPVAADSAEMKIIECYINQTAHGQPDGHKSLLYSGPDAHELPEPAVCQMDVQVHNV